jgi:hypothetical protein
LQEQIIQTESEHFRGTLRHSGKLEEISATKQIEMNLNNSLIVVNSVKNSHHQNLSLWKEAGSSETMIFTRKYGIT